MALRTSSSKNESPKGFIYTLEAIIAATLFITMVTVVIPQSGPEVSREVQENVRSGLESLDKPGELRDNLTVSGVENETGSFLPSGYNQSVKIIEVKTETRSFSSPDEFYFNKSGSHTEVQFWIENANGLDAEFKGNKILEGRDSAGYVEKTLSGSTGFLNFTGTGSGTFDFDVYTSEGETPDREDLKTVNYIVKEDNLTEVRVFLWS